MAKDRWFKINGYLKKNPTDEELKSYDKTQITEYIQSDYDDNTIVEKWYVGTYEDARLMKGTEFVLTWMYSLDEVTDLDRLNMMRNSYFKNFQYTSAVNLNTHKFMKSVELPKSWFSDDGIMLHWYGWEEGVTYETKKEI